MFINRLDKEELIYELTFRGIGTGNCEEMRRRLSMALQMEKNEDSLKYPKYPFTFIQDQLAVKKSLDDLMALLADFNNGRNSGEAMKIQTKLSHTLGRLDNMDTEGKEENLKEKSELLALTLSLMERFNEKVNNFDRRTMPASLSLLESQVEARAFQEDIHNASGSSAINDINLQGVRNSTLPGMSNKLIPPHKWDLKKFSGDSKGISVNAFFERVEELRLARNVPKEFLLESGIDLFAEKAYHFYKDCRARVHTWDELVEEFRGEYLSANHNDVLFEELQKRTQHPSESIGIYLAVMSGYFSRLRCTISEQTKLSIIMKNLHPFYQDRLTDPSPRTIVDLRDACRRLEAKRDIINSYSEPTSRRSNAIEKDLAFVEVMEEIQSVAIAGPSRDTNQRKEIVCYRCQQPGHRAVGCAMRKKLECFKCHKEGYTVRTCPTCSHQGNGNDERPYLKVSVLGKSLLGLLDSGASATILGNRGWKILQDLKINLNTTRTVTCTVANGQSVRSIVPELPHTLILGANFWKSMGIVPDLRHNEWYFSDQPPSLTVDEVDHLRSQTVLTPLQESRLKALIDRNVALMGTELGCTDLTEHVEAQPLRFPSWRVCNGYLYKYVRPTFVELSDSSDSWKEVVPKERRKQVISAAHDPPTSGHMGQLEESEKELGQAEENIREDGFRKLFKEVRKRLDEAAKKNQRVYNLRRRHEEFLPNQMVWKRNFVLSDAAKYYTSKLAPKYVGPYYVKKRVSPWTYELRDGNGVSKGVWNIKDLKVVSINWSRPDPTWQPRGMFREGKGRLTSFPDIRDHFLTEVIVGVSSVRVAWFLWDLVCYLRSLDHVTPGVGPWPPDCIAAYQILDGLVGCRTPAAVHSPLRSIQDFCCRGHPSSCMDT
ncbi:hypothetical protein NQ317_017076 [Molorchus minor]|uniref:CCHC-type domain-containing protein n=1 Tax=Molorchus minor TaxID=1323400 RepID=A0ABQ9K569_9CUCU|nr:hypothetical protein NQ317_017076 [Molorchus minor]